jgi:uncharacterized protein
VILADTGFFLALANARDQNHAAAKAALSRVRSRLITTWPVMTETCHLLASRLSPGAAGVFVDSAAQGAFDLFALEAAHLPRIAGLMRKYQDLPMDLADASLVLLAEHAGTGKILTTDRRDFGAYRWKERRPFENLLRVR